ncbi:MAG TPA: MFS transporter [Candidatus Limnocylindrales bacterium]
MGETRARAVLWAAILGSGIVFLDSTVVNVALAQIGQQLPHSLVGVFEGQSYVYNGYLLTLSALLVLAGALTDAYGRRRMFALGLAGFGATSLLCGLAPSMELLIVFRLVQGAAGALLVPGSLALITTTFRGEEQGRAFGLWAGASAATSILGPFVGGLLVQLVSWRAAFLLNVPFLIVALWLTLRYVPESREPRAGRRFDWLGAAVIAVAVGGLTFGAIYGQQRDWRDPLAFAALGVGALATIALPVLMATRPNPLVPLDLFRSRNFSVTNLSTLLIYGALYVNFFFQALFAQGVLGYSPSAAGLLGVPGSLLLALFSARFGVLGARYGQRRFMAVGPAVMAVGVLWLARVPATSPAWQLRPDQPASFLPPGGYLLDFLPAALVFGAGLAMMVAPLTTALMTSVPPSRAGLGSAINNAISRVGPQLAGAAIFVAITSSFYAGIAGRVSGVDPASPSLRAAVAPLASPPASLAPAVAAAARDASTDAYHVAMLVSAGLLLAGALVNWLGIRTAGTARAVDAADDSALTSPAD